jgi:hypothetical protein
VASGAEVAPADAGRPPAQFRWPSNACPSRSTSRLAQNSANRHAISTAPRQVASRISVSLPSSGRCLKAASENNALPKIKLSRPKKKQEQVIQDHVRMPERHCNVAHAVPKRDLHRAENASRNEIRDGVLRKLLARIDGDLPELRQLLPDKDNRAQYLNREQQQIEFRRRAFAAGLHRANDIGSAVSWQMEHRSSRSVRPDVFVQLALYRGTGPLSPPPRSTHTPPSAQKVGFAGVSNGR